MDTANRRILLLKMINENKEYLFGHPLSPKWSKVYAVLTRNNLVIKNEIDVYRRPKHGNK